MSKKGQTHSTPRTASQSPDTVFKNQQMRPSLRKDVADEIRQSFVIRKSKKLQERKKLVSQVMIRRESKRTLECSNHNARQEKKSANYPFNDNVALIMENSIHHVINESPSKPIVNGGNNKQPFRGITTGEGIQMNEQIQSDFYACKMECVRLKVEKKALKIKLATRDAQTSLLDQQVTDLTSETKTLRKQIPTGGICRMCDKMRCI